MLFGHIDDCADELDGLAVPVDDGMPDVMNISQAAVGQENSPVDIEILLFLDRGVENLEKICAIFRKDSLKGFVEGLRVLDRIKTEYPVELRRPIDVLTTGDVPGPASRVRQPLSFLEIRFD